MTSERTVIRAISWRDLFPWLLLLRTVRLAAHPAALAAATLAFWLTIPGWWIGARVFLTAEQRTELSLQNSQLPAGSPQDMLASHLPLAAAEYFPASAGAVAEPYRRLSEPVARLLRIRGSVGEAAYCLWGTLWSLTIWGLAGGFISRLAIVRLATDEPEPLKTSARLALRRYLSYVLAPLYPLLGLLILGLPIALLGLAIRLSPGGGSILVGLLWIFVVLASLPAAWLLGGLLFGWPLMWSAISGERDGDSFEAFSRSFSYVYGQPLRYFFYVVVVLLLGALGLAVVQIAINLILGFAFGMLSWGAGGESVTEIQQLIVLIQAGAELPAERNELLTFGATLFALVSGIVQSTLHGFAYSYLFVTAAGIYLLLRQDVDETEFDEIYLPAEERKPSPPASSTPASTSATTTPPAAAQPVDSPLAPAPSPSSPPPPPPPDAAAPHTGDETGPG
jgi:hypothetical protein